MPTNRWMSGDVRRGAAYDKRFADLAATGVDMHGEASFVESYGPASVLDAGCGTGRVAIELDRRGIRAVGLDLDRAMLAEARRKAPHLDWIEADLAHPTRRSRVRSTPSCWPATSSSSSSRAPRAT